MADCDEVLPTPKGCLRSSSSSSPSSLLLIVFSHLAFLIPVQPPKPALLIDLVVDAGAVGYLSSIVFHTSLRRIGSVVASVMTLCPFSVVQYDCLACCLSFVGYLMMTPASAWIRRRLRWQCRLTDFVFWYLYLALLLVLSPALFSNIFTQRCISVSFPALLFNIFI
ncbi:hypothetical protein F4861DRAFT_516523 [Xylaria intraflava]|nr:hypothetical protein F4861DRAFT_516523 [Xylaria intraflava]